MFRLLLFLGRRIPIDKGQEYTMGVEMAAAKEALAP